MIESNYRLRWAYAGPLLSGVGALMLIVGLSGWPGPRLVPLGSLGLAAVFLVIVRRQSEFERKEANHDTTRSL